MTQPHWTKTSPKRSGKKNFRSNCFQTALLATTGLAAVTLAMPSHAQTVWNGTSSGNWFSNPNWSAGAPTNATDAEIDTVANNLPRIEGSPAEALGVVVGNTDNGVLTIQLGGTLASQTGTIGQLGNSNGSVSVIGDGAAWTVSSSIVVGNNGSGTLNIVNGGDVSSAGATLGNGTAGFGSVIVTGNASTWTNTGSLVIANLGSAVLNIDNGGKVNAGAANIAVFAGTEGTINVTGGGSAWESSGTLRIGRAGDATINVLDGGRVSTHHAFIAEAGGSSGEVVVSGADSEWVSTGNVMVGLQGKGKMTVTDGATAEIQHSVIGFDASGVGTMYVMGDGSTLQISNHLFVGGDGMGGFVVVGGGLAMTDEGTIASAASSVGAALIWGSGSTWTNSGLLIVGNNGRADLRIENGGKVSTAGANIARFGQSQSVVTVNGSGSILENSSFLFVGGDGNGAMSVEAGGHVTNSDGSIGRNAGSNGGVIVTGSGSRWTNSGTLAVGWEGSGTLTVQQGGKVTAALGVLGADPGSFGSASVTGNGSAWVNTGDLFVGGQGTGRLVVANGASVAAGGGSTVIASAPGSTGTISIGAAAGLAPLAPGTLQSARLVFGQGAGTLAFNHTAQDYLFASKIEGVGKISALSGTTRFDADSGAFGGSAEIHGGAVLVVDGRLGGTLHVLEGGRLEGSGTVGTTHVASGAVVAPGNSIGTLNVQGDVTFAAGSLYEVEVDPAGTEADRLHASGTATLNGGTVSHVGLDGAYKPFKIYTIMTADNGVIGTFGSVTSDFAFLDPRLSYDPNNVFLSFIRNDVSFCEVAVTANQCAAGAGAQSLGQGNELYDALVALDEDTARNAFDQISGEIHASIRGAMLEDSRFVRDAATSRIRTAFAAVAAPSMPALAYGEGGPAPAAAGPERAAVWTEAFGAWGQLEGDGNAAKLDRNTAGILIGGDAPVFETWRVGILAGYSHSSFDVDERASSGDSDNYHLGVYGGSQWGGLGLRFGAAYTWHDLETDRSVDFGGFTDRLKADYDASTAQVFGELGYRVDTPSVAFEPFASVAYVNVHSDAFSETGGAAALAGASGDTDATFTTLGIRASSDFMLGGVKATARGMLGWRHAFGDVTPLAAVAFAGGDVFTIAGTPIARDAATLEVGLDIRLTQQAMFGISYDGQFGSGLSDHSAKANLAIRF